MGNADLLILDEWMRDALTVPQAQDLLEVLDDRYGHTATMVVSQVPISDWHIRLPDATFAEAILDRLIHNAHRISVGCQFLCKIESGTSILRNLTVWMMA